MRRVGQAEIDRMRRVLDELEIFTQRYSEDALAAARNVNALANDGHIAEAEALGSAEQARLALKVPAVSAHVEAAVVGFLGERRRPDESFHAYADRIVETMHDLSRVIAMQRRNGLMLTL